MAPVHWGWSLLSQMGDVRMKRRGTGIPRERAEVWSKWDGAGRRHWAMLWGAGLEGSRRLLLRIVVLRPAGDSASDLWSSCLPRPEPGAVGGHA